MGFPGCSVVKNLSADAGNAGVGVQSLDEEDPLKQKMLQFMKLQRVRHD